MKREALTAMVKSALREIERQGAKGDVLALAGRYLAVECRNGAAEKMEESFTQSLTCRVFRGRRSGISSTTDTTAGGIRRCAEKAHEIAALTQEDEAAGLPEAAPEPILHLDLELRHDEAIGKRSREEKLALAVETEEAATAVKGITASNGASYYESLGMSALGDSRGFLGYEEGTSYGLSVSVVAEDKGGTKREGYDYDSHVAFSALRSPAALGRRAAERAVDKLGAAPIPTARLPILFENEVAVQLVGRLLGSLTGTAFYKKSSIFIGQEGKKIAADLLTLIDDPLLPRAPGSRLFDGEGAASRKNTLVKNGVLTGLLLDTYTARKLGRKSSASASRGRGSAPYPAASNVILSPGSETPQQLAARYPRLFWVTDLLGFHFNPVSGDLSSGASGFLYADGQRRQPLSEMTFAGNLQELLHNLAALGNDPYLPSAIRAPSLLVSEMAVSGK